MANATDPLAKSVRGTDPQNLMERITRDKVYAMTYWKEKCFGVSAEALVDLAVDLRSVGGIYGGNNRATEFLCLTLKLLQIQPEKEIVLEFIKNEDHKYVRLLGAFYLRLVGKPTDVYRYLEPLLNDYRKVRYRTRDGKYALTHVDEFVNNLLTKDMFCDVTLPRVPHRQVLEAAGALEPRVSALEEDIADLEEELESAVEEAIGQRMNMDVDAGEAAAAASTRGAREDGEIVASGSKRSREHDGVRYRECDDSDGDRYVRRRERSRSRSRDRVPARRDDARPGVLASGEEMDHREKKEKKEKKEKREKKEKTEMDPEIAEANAIRAKLGLKPLRG
ncbi:Pre-mRNA-splicing factor 38 [Ostreococcus tauri]|uniref:Pre-mRNA-splicing factor 38 n=1 Tax=Ostreococcus tauri TaxID=70448 RepID=A0A090N2S3_OSTTA|nr:Pre-mRNA-splicing factor 38 [Ostreococcus tauri]OUS42575.1 PRP38 family-domain-containing protein [Ostreococcus tauri]CEF96738.1 Pre-mRNA-splicing factor 38 [Ostreococcus tauri]|eukprot:XP_022838269.1 Pre-mRNA-splicing factor 38 [Ostreococcus tauri]